MIAFELLYGKRPYRGKTNSSLTSAILKDPLRFPELPQTALPISAAGIDFLQCVSDIVSHVTVMADQSYSFLKEI